MRSHRLELRNAVKPAWPRAEPRPLRKVHKARSKNRRPKFFFLSEQFFFVNIKFATECREGIFLRGTGRKPLQYFEYALTYAKAKLL